MADPIRTRRPRSRVTRHRSHITDPRLALRSYSPRAGVVVVSVDGEIDLANRDLLAAQLSAPTDDPAIRLVVCDLSATTFLACSGLSVLLDVKTRLTARGATLRVVTADSAVLRMLEATGQQAVLDVRPLLTAAIPGADEVLEDLMKPPEEPPADSNLAELKTALARAVEQTTQLAATWGRLAAQVAALDADRLVDGRGGHWQPRETLAEMAEDLRVLQNHLATGALLAAPTVEDLGHLRGMGGKS
jgi:anti-anti-sigma factor